MQIIVLWLSHAIEMSIIKSFSSWSLSAYSFTLLDNRTGFNKCHSQQVATHWPSNKDMLGLLLPMALAMTTWPDALGTQYYRPDWQTNCFDLMGPLFQVLAMNYWLLLFWIGPLMLILGTTKLFYDLQNEVRETEKITPERSYFTSIIHRLSRQCCKLLLTEFTRKLKL